MNIRKFFGIKNNPKKSIETKHVQTELSHEVENRIYENIEHKHESLSFYSGSNITGNEEGLKMLKEATHLKTLIIVQNKVSNISFLKYLTELQHLGLQLNQIVDISVLKELKQLETLDLGDNQISHISLEFLNALPKLEKLYLDGNPIENIPKEILGKINSLEIKYFLQQEYLLKLITELHYSLFFIETKKIGKRNAELVSLEKKFMHDGGRFEFAEQLKVWVLHNFE
jgi:Leucine-rich repeat (LRR) protein